jgi:hypothetical protein
LIISVLGLNPEGEYAVFLIAALTAPVLPGNGAYILGILPTGRYWRKSSSAGEAVQGNGSGV